MKRELGRGHFVGTLAVIVAKRGDVEPHFLADRTAEEPAYAVLLPAGRLHDLGQSRALLPAQEFQDLGLFAAFPRCCGLLFATGGFFLATGLVTETCCLSARPCRTVAQRW